MSATTKIQTLVVRVAYKVTLRDVQVTLKEFNQLDRAFQHCEVFSAYTAPADYADAANVLTLNVSESDMTEKSYEVIDIY